MADYPIITQRGEEVPWVELRCKSMLANTVEDIDRNIESALRRNLVSFQELVETKSGAVSIVGSGPSLKDNWQRIAEVGGDVIACNAACQFLLERDVVPQYMFCFDADPLMLEFITPHPDITYLIASRCPPQTFDLLQGCKIVCWHAQGDENINTILENQHPSRMEPLIPGGSAAVTRAMVMAQPMGYREIHLWGCDSSFLNGDTHIRTSTTQEKRLQILCNNRAFHCAPWMAQQAQDFKVLAPPLRDTFGVKLIVHGDGLIPHLAKAMGFDVDGEARSTQLWRAATTKARILWSQL